MSYSQRVNAGLRGLRDGDRPTKLTEYETEWGPKKKKPRKNPDVFENTPPTIGAGGSQ